MNALFDKEECGSRSKFVKRVQAWKNHYEGVQLLEVLDPITFQPIPLSPNHVTNNSESSISFEIETNKSMPCASPAQVVDDNDMQVIESARMFF